MVSNNFKNNDDLVKLLNAAEKPTNEHKNVEDLAPNDVYSFLLYFNIKPGYSTIRKSMLFTLYKHWSKSALSRKSFHGEVGKYIRSKQSGCNYYYKISLNAFDISEKLFQYLQQQDKTKSNRWKKHYEYFLTKNDIKPGSHWVECITFFRYYFKWKAMRCKPRGLGYNQFFNISKLYFKHKRLTDSKGRWFGLNRDLKKELPARYIDMYRKKHNARLKNNKKNKKKSK